MAYNYDPISKTAQKLIEKFGRTVTIVRDGTALTPTVKVVEDTAMPKDAPGHLIQVGDKSLLLAARGLAVTIDAETDKLSDAGSVLRIVWAKPIKPGSTIVIYQLLVR